MNFPSRFVASVAYAAMICCANQPQFRKKGSFRLAKAMVIMITLGLTGATGAGKGVFADYAVRTFDAVHIDTDRIAREVAEKGRPALKEIAEAFGKDVLHPDGTLDRAALAAVVFADKEKLERLNHITHRYILLEAQRRMDKAKADGKALCILDAPLLFESGAEKMCDVTVGVIADEKVRKERIMARDGLTEEKADERLRNAKDAGFFIRRCDHILENNASTADFASAAHELLSRLTENKENSAHA